MAEPLMPNQPPRDYLVIPPNPVPNGSLHLGHMAGPFLRLDVLARHLRRRGDRPVVIFGTHPYDSLVTLRAAHDQRSLAETSEFYYSQIRSALEGLEIGFDTFIDPVAPQWSERFDHSYQDLVRRLQASGHVESIEERLPYDTARSEFVVGCSLQGRCPECDAGMSGFICEDCGSLFQPQALRSSQRRETTSKLTWRPIQNLFFRIRDPEAVIERLRATETPRNFQEICRRHFRQQESDLIRLTLPGTWGVPWAKQESSLPRILVDSGFIYSYCYLCGEVYSEITNTENPFHEGSSTTIINGFGLDNAITHMVYVQAMALAQEGFRSIDRFIVNFFYLLEGEKFSTSRGHAIWVNELLRQTRVPSDAIRYFLASTTLSQQRESFEPDRFVRVLNEKLAAGLYPTIAGYLSRLESTLPGPPAVALVNRLREALEAQEEGLDYRDFDPHRVVDSIDRWLSTAESGSDASSTASSNTAYWWLKGFALLAEPIMPKLARELWQALGAHGTPTYREALEATCPRWNPHVSSMEAVHIGDLAPCLPATLTSSDAAIR